MTLKEAAGIIGFIKGLPSYYSSHGEIFQYRTITFRQINNFIEMIKFQVDDVHERTELDIFKEKA